MRRLAFGFRLSAFGFILLATLYSLLSTHPAEAVSTVTSVELLQDPEKYDGETVIYKGEVIGDIMIRKDFAWINVQDESGTIGIYCPKDLIAVIEYQGGYRFKGDSISVRGVFQRFCGQHGGDSDIHAEKIAIIQQGEPLPRPLEPQKVKASIILSAAAFVLAIVHLLVKKFRT